MFNNFHLSHLSVPLESSLETYYLKLVILESYIKDQEKDHMWKNIYANTQRRPEETAFTGGDQDDKPTGGQEDISE
jgi:hypothetical protein